MSRVARSAVVAVFSLGLAISAANEAKADRALTVEGKETLFQRVLTKPGAVLTDSPGGSGSHAVPPFTAFYVYAREDGWTRVGDRIEGEALGWLGPDRTVDWHQTIVASFNNLANRSQRRALMFEDRDSLMRLINAENVAAVAQSYREAAAAGERPEGSGIISIEPAEHVDISEQLYILPIFEAHEVRLPGRNRGKVLRVASVPLEEQSETTDRQREDALRRFPIEVAFVIDTTISMDPYIAQTKRAVSELARRISDAGIGKKLRFALIGFRDNTRLAPDLQYVTRTFLDFGPEADAAAFARAAEGLEVARASSVGFNEDSAAGIHAAITELNWDAAAAKMIFLVTDAGPRIEHRQIPDLREEQLRQLAETKKMAIWTWHLKPLHAVFDHASAEEAYRTLSRFQGTETYTGIDLADPAAFGSAVDETLTKLEGMLEAAAQGRLANEARGADPDDPMTRVGLAMQLAYLGQVLDTGAPDLFEAWLVSTDVPDFRKNALDIRILLSKNQLATLRDVVATIVTKAEEGVLDPSGFFSQLRSALALLAQDSSRIVDAEFSTLGEAAGDFLEGLPYRSALMNLSERDWVVMSGGSQRELLDRLKSKLRAYEEIHDDPGLWTALSEGAPDGEHVAAISLDLMP